MKNIICYSIFITLFIFLCIGCEKRADKNIKSVQQSHSANLKQTNETATKMQPGKKEESLKQKNYLKEKNQVRNNKSFAFYKNIPNASFNYKNKTFAFLKDGKNFDLNKLIVVLVVAAFALLALFQFVLHRR